MLARNGHDGTEHDDEEDAATAATEVKSESKRQLRTGPTLTPAKAVVLKKQPTAVARVNGSTTLESRKRKEQPTVPTDDGDGLPEVAATKRSKIDGGAKSISVPLPLPLSSSSSKRATLVPKSKPMSKHSVVDVVATQGKDEVKAKTKPKPKNEKKRLTAVERRLTSAEWLGAKDEDEAGSDGDGNEKDMDEEKEEEEEEVEESEAKAPTSDASARDFQIAFKAAGALTAKTTPHRKKWTRRGRGGGDEEDDPEWGEKDGRKKGKGKKGSSSHAVIRGSILGTMTGLHRQLVGGLQELEDEDSGENKEPPPEPELDANGERMLNPRECHIVTAQGQLLQKLMEWFHTMKVKEMYIEVNDLKGLLFEKIINNTVILIRTYKKVFDVWETRAAPPDPDNAIECSAHAAALANNETVPAVLYIGQTVQALARSLKMSPASAVALEHSYTGRVVWSHRKTDPSILQAELQTSEFSGLDLGLEAQFKYRVPHYEFVVHIPLARMSKICKSLLVVGKNVLIIVYRSYIIFRAVTEKETRSSTLEAKVREPRSQEYLLSPGLEPPDRFIAAETTSTVTTDGASKDENDDDVSIECNAAPGDDPLDEEFTYQAEFSLPMLTRIAHAERFAKYAKLYFCSKQLNPKHPTPMQITFNINDGAGEGSIFVMPKSVHSIV